MSGWSREHPRCRQCGTQKTIHRAHGYCITCYTAVVDRGHDPAAYKPHRTKQTKREKIAAASKRQREKPPSKERRAAQNKRAYLRKKADAAETSGDIEAAKRLRQEAEAITE